MAVKKTERGGGGGGGGSEHSGKKIVQYSLTGDWRALNSKASTTTSTRFSQY